MICTWLGPLPSYAPLFAASAADNTGLFEWIVVTDQRTPLWTPSSVRFVHMKQEELEARITRQTGLRVPLDNPRKLCDLKPLYGSIFSDLLSGSTHWGHTDLDVVWGNITGALEKDIETHDIVSTDARWISGFCSIYRNEDRINDLWREMDAADVLQSPSPAVFDERLFTVRVSQMPDVSVSYRQVHAPDSLSPGFFYESGRLTDKQGKEYALLHFHHWKLHVRVDQNLEKSRCWSLTARAFQAIPGNPPAAVPAMPLSCGIITSSSSPDIQHLHELSKECRSFGIQISTIDTGLDSSDREWCTQEGIPMLIKTSDSLPEMLKASPYDITLWIAPGYGIAGPLDEAFELLRSRMLISRMPDTNPLHTSASHNVIGWMKGRETDESILKEWSTSKDGTLLSALDQLRCRWMLSTNNRWNGSRGKTAKIVQRSTTM